MNLQPDFLVSDRKRTLFCPDDVWHTYSKLMKETRPQELPLWLEASDTGLSYKDILGRPTGPPPLIGHSAYYRPWPVPGPRSPSILPLSVATTGLVEHTPHTGAAPGNLAEVPASALRRIKNAKIINPPPPQSPNIVRWEFEQGSVCSGWMPFYRDDAALVEQHWRQWRSSENPQDGGSVIHVTIGNSLYEINFVVMEQTSLRTGQVRHLRRQEGHTMTNIATSGDSLAVGHVALQAEMERMRAELARTKAQAERSVAAEDLLKELLEQSSRQAVELEEQASSLRDLQQELEIWTLQDADDDVMCTFDRPHMKSAMQMMLRQLVPPSHHCKCDQMRYAVVTRVIRVANTRLWRQYSLQRQQIGRALRRRQNCPWIDDVCCSLLQLHSFLDDVTLDAGANETLLLHGTEAGETIARHGFDDRLSRRALYGSGVYLSVDACKAGDSQYCGNSATSCVVVARAILGHPYLAQGPMETHLRPPMVDCEAVPHDSTIAMPGIPNSQGKGGLGKGKGIQAHWEFVVPSCQLYPEYLVYFTRPS